MSAHRGYRVCPVAGLLALLVLAGCSGAPQPTYPVEGVVTLDGRALDGGSVIFEPAEASPDGKRHSARGGIGPDGRYRLSTFGTDDGAVAGRHRVVVFPKPGELVDDPKAAARPLIPPRYSSMQASGLEYEVKPEGNRINIELHSK